MRSSVWAATFSITWVCAKAGRTRSWLCIPVAETHSTLAGWSDPLLPAPTLPVAGMWGAWGVGVAVGRTGGWMRALESIVWYCAFLAGTLRWALATIS